MGNLVFLDSTGQAVTNSLLIAGKFEKEHRHVLDSIRGLLSSAENSAVLSMFVESRYIASNGKENPMYVMNYDGFSLLVMGFTGEKALKFKLEYIDAFNKYKALLQSDDYILNRSFEILKNRVELEQQKRLAAENRANRAEEANRVMKPKADFVDRVIETVQDKVDIGQAAKLLKLPYGRNSLFKTLREKGVFFKNKNEPKQEFIDRGYFELKEKEVTRDHHSSFMVIKVLVTQKGLLWLDKILNGNRSDFQMAKIV